MTIKFRSKGAILAAKRLANNWTRNFAIPTKEFNYHSSMREGDKRRVYLIPVKHILRSEYKYGHYRDWKKSYKIYKQDYFNQDQAEKWAKSHPERVNVFRRALRNKRFNLIPPIKVRKIGKHHFSLLDGHHRLTAHQAEGKKLIRAVFEDDPLE